MSEQDGPKFTDIPSLGHELGIMFGFIALMAIVMTAYAITWKGKTPLIYGFCPILFSRWNNKPSFMQLTSGLWCRG